MTKKEQTEEKKNEVVTTKSTSLSAGFSQYAGAGAENITRDDIKMPHLKIIEGGSDYVKQGSDDYIDEAKVGDIINTATKELYTNKTDGVLIIPVINKKLFTEWAPRGSEESTGRPVAYHELPPADAKEVEVSTEIGTKKVLKRENGNEIVETQYYFVIILDKDNNPIPGIIDMSSTRLSSARELNTCIYNYTQKGLPAFAAIIKLKTVFKQKGGKSWNIYTVSKVKEHALLKDGFLDIEGSAKELFEYTANQYNIALKDKNFFINVATTDSDNQGEGKKGSDTKSEAVKGIL